MSPQVVNTILWNPNADDLFATSSSWSASQVQYSDIEDGNFNGQSGNFSRDPLLDDTDHLMPCSPAIDAGTLDGAPLSDIDDELRPWGSAPDVGADELSLPCVLRAAKVVSASQARYGDTLTYTLRVTNTTPLTTVTAILTDVLPAAVRYVPTTLIASQGVAAYHTGTVTWTGTLVPSDTVTIKLAAKVVLVKTMVRNFLTIDTIDYGIFNSRAAVTQIGPLTCYLPLIYRNYCGGPFLDNFSNPASGWPSADTAYWVNGYLNGEYRLSAKRAAFGAVTRGDRSDNLIVEVDVRQSSAVNGSLGLMFYLNDDWSNFYTFEIYPATQEYAIFRYLNDQWSLVAYGLTGAIHAGQNTNRLRITSQGEQYSFWINNTALGAWYFGAEARRVGLTATSDAAGFEASL